MVVIRFVWMIVSFVFEEVFIFLPLYLLGLVAFPFAYHFGMLTIKPSFINKGQDIIAFQNRVLDEWLGNREDGLLPSWWVKERSGTAYGWFVRNPVSNMRFWPIVSTLPRPEKTGWVGSLDYVPNSPNETGWFFCWEGWYAGFLYQGKRFGCWVGWKTNPMDRRIGKLNGPQIDYRSYGLGTTLQAWWNK